MCCIFSHTQSDVLISVTSVIGYIFPLKGAAILTAAYDLLITLCIFLCQISSALELVLVSVALLIVPNIKIPILVSLLN